MSALQGGVPPGTRLILRGSAVQGESYRTGEPFDARGPGTSDLDVVLLGDEAMAAWEPEAFYLPGVNTQPLDDDAPDLADPRLERARRLAQEAAGRRWRSRRWPAGSSTCARGCRGRHTWCSAADRRTLTLWWCAWSPTTSGSVAAVGSR